jgi:hypothetical protein
MVLLIVLAVLAIVGIVGTLIVLPTGQDNRFSERQRYASHYNANRLS